MPNAATSSAANPAARLNLTDWVEVFKAGKHSDSQGRQAEFTPADLDQMVVNHKLGAAPAVLGHPKTDDPAYAWTAGLKRDGNSLLAKFEDINPAFEAGVGSGAYRNRSVRVLKDPAHGWRVRHVGWLGATPPAIDGLATNSRTFNAPADAESHDFAAPGYSLVWALESVGTLLRAMREQLIAKEGIEAADKVLPSWQIDSVVTGAEQARAEYQKQDGDTPAYAYSNPHPGETMSQITEADVKKAADEAVAAALTAKDAEFALQAKELTDLKATQTRERIAGLVTGWKAKGLVTPAEEHGMVEFMTQLDSATTFDFTAADKSTAKKSPSTWFVDFVASRKPVVRLGNVSDAGDGTATGVDMNDANAIVTAATAFQFSEKQAGRVISVDQAVQHVKDAAGAAAR